MNNVQRKPLRLQGYDYSQNGAYFITICVYDKLHLFGEVIDNNMQLNNAGRLLETLWLDIPHRFNHIHLDQYIVMPNHFHSILFMESSLFMQNKNNGSAKATIGDVVGAFKSLFAYEYIKSVKSLDWQPFNKKLWQRNYYEHVIRDDASLHKIREYIVNNPMNWGIDEMNIAYKTKPI